MRERLVANPAPGHTLQAVVAHCRSRVQRRFDIALIHDLAVAL